MMTALRLLQPLCRIPFSLTRLLALLMLLYTGCSVLKPERPAEQYNPVSYIPRPSLINLPFETDATILKKIINRQFTGVIYNDTSFDDHDRDNLMIRAARTDSITLAIDRNQITYRVPLQIGLKKRITAGLLGYNYSTTQEANAEIALKFKTTVSLNKDWTLQTVTQSEGYDWISYPKLKAGVVQIPLPVISDLLMNANMTLITKGIDRSVKESFNLKTLMSGAWNSMQKPVLISPEYALWLKVSPEEISTVPIRSVASSLRHTVGLTARVELFWGREPEYSVNPVLPNLKITSALPENFQINFALDMPFTHIDSLAASQFSGYVYKYGKYTLKVNKISVYGQGDLLVVALEVEGSLKGSIYLTGKPVYNKENMTISLSELDFQLSTRNALVKTASWLFHSGLVQKLSENLVFPIGSTLREAQTEMNSFLKKSPSFSQFKFTGKLDKIEPDQILITRGSVKAYFRFEGNIKLSLLHP